MSTFTSSLAQSNVGPKYLHAGATQLSVNFDAPTLTAAEISVLHMCKIPTGARIHDVKAYIDNSVQDAGIYNVTIGTVTIGSACIASGLTQIPSLHAKEVTTGGSASETAWRYLNINLTPTTLAASTRAILSVIYSVDNPINSQA
jgi:hypothetical protein